MKTISLNPLGQKDYLIQVGQYISYSFEEYPSVGTVSEYYISDESVLALKEKKRKLKNPRRKHLSGADESDVTFVFEGKARGITSLVLREMFRGAVANEFKFKIEVE